jgi:hypothetical protein
MTSGPDMSARTPPRRVEALREVTIFAVAYLSYAAVRVITEGSAHQAMANAAALFRLESAVGTAWEPALQRAVLGQPLLLDAAGDVYAFGYWPVILTAGVLLFRFRPEHCYRLRNTFLLSAVVGLVIFALLPVAPPRLAGVGVVDAITEHAGLYRRLVPASLVNEYAAMPSFHVGWTLVLGIVVLQATRRPVLRALAVLMPIAMTLAVVATANHFVADAVAGAAIASVMLVVVQSGERRAPRRSTGGRRPRPSRRGVSTA